MVLSWISKILTMRFAIILLVLLSPLMNNAQNVILGRSAAPLNGEVVTDNFSLFSKDKGVFIGGQLSSSPNWSPDSLGLYSFGWGKNVKSKGEGSLAIGDQSIALGLNSVSIGIQSLAEGPASFALGNQAYAKGTFSYAFGSGARALGNESFALGNVEANGSSSFATGVGNETNGNVAFVFGQNNLANGNNSFAGGSDSYALGDNSTSIGTYTSAISYNEFVVGYNNTTYTPNSSTGWVSSDRLFVIGNGISSPSDAMVVTKNGDVAFPDGSMIIGAHLPPQNGVSTSSSIVMYDKDKSAFRGGELSGSTNWSPDSLGLYSFGWGKNVKSKGEGSLAIGDQSIALGLNSVSIGIQSLAEGPASFALGNQAYAKGTFSYAFGSGARALGNESFALGNVEANGSSSFATGVGNETNGNVAFVFGQNNLANGNNSFAGGSDSYALGDNSTSIGTYTSAISYNEFVVGYNNTTYTPNSSTGWVSSDRLFVIGNGISSPSDAMVVTKNGDVTFPDGSFLVGRDSMPKNGEIVDTVMMFYNNEKSAFRGGELSNSNAWSPDSIGDYSFGYGEDVKAKGIRSTAFGNSTSALGNNAFAVGWETVASGRNSIAAGQYSSAIALGSAAFGTFTTARSWGEFVLGYYNTDYEPVSLFGPNENDRLFVIGNGTSSQKSDAMVVLKNGNTTINGETSINGRLGIRESNPDKEFHIKGQAKIEAYNAGSDANFYMQSGTGSEGRILVYQKTTEDMYIGDIDNVGNNVFFRAGGDERITILDNGNVGIGKNVPTAELDVVGSICYTGSSSACSDLRYKTNFSPIVSALSKVNQLNGLYYYWNQEQYPNKEFSNEKQIGVIAQEVEVLFPEMVFTDSEGYKSVDYSRLTPVLIEAVKELSNKNDILEKKILEMERANLDQKVQKSLISEMQSELESLKVLVSGLAQKSDSN